MGILDVILPVGCAGCGRGRGSPCGRCVAAMDPGGWVSGLDVPALAAVVYSGAARELVVALKYRRRRDALAWMADAVTATAAWASVSADVVTWVPASVEGRRSRGFDQGRLLAAAVGSRLGLPVVGALERRGAGRQVGRDRAGRALGAAAVGTMRRSATAVADARVLVVDDVITTGASMIAAHRAVRSAGATSVVGVAFAHAP